MKIEESELLAALLTAQMMEKVAANQPKGSLTPKEYLTLWREQYLQVLREFIELEKTEYEKGEK